MFEEKRHETVVSEIIDQESYCISNFTLYFKILGSIATDNKRELPLLGLSWELLGCLGENSF